VLDDRGLNLDRESVRVRPQNRPDPPFKGCYGSEKKRPAKNPRYGKAKTPPAFHSRSFASIAAQNLINMVAVFIASGAVLLGLLLVKHL
jgi:hypothetical protein